MRHPRHAHATAPPQPAESDATAADDVADVVSLDTWRHRASAASGPPHQDPADARAAHPAQLWAGIRASEARAATPS